MDSEEKLFAGCFGGIGCLVLLVVLTVIAAIIVGLIIAWRNFA